MLSKCKALLVAADENFGLVQGKSGLPGRPVIAVAAGGALEASAGLYLESTRKSQPGSQPGSLMQAMLRSEAIKRSPRPLPHRAGRPHLPLFRKIVSDLLSTLAGARLPGIAGR